MTKETIVKVANDLINRKGDMNLWMEIVSDYCNKKDKKKAPNVISIFPSLPQDVQLNIINFLIKHYCREFGIFSVGIQDNSSTFIINGVKQDNYKPIYYYI